MSQLFDDVEFATRLTQAEEFGAPLVTILDAQQGYWQDRRAQWERDFPALARREDVGRDVIGGGVKSYAPTTSGATAIIARKSADISTFDPVVAEVAYRWWTIPGDEIYDPFAGGPCRGLVAASMGRRYFGVDVSAAQVDHNEDHAIDGARWREADAASFHPHPCDFVFSCPPYGSLERYSDAVHDMSTMSWRDFQSAYRHAIRRSVDALRNHRFAAFVVGNFKEKRQLRDLVGVTVAAFEAAGADYYADLILATPLGSAPMQAVSTFPANRRPMPRHQYVLVFVKGDPRAAARRITEGDMRAGLAAV